VKILHAFSTFKPAGPQLRFLNLANQWGNEFEHVVLAMDDNLEAAAMSHSSYKMTTLKFSATKGSGLGNSGRINDVVRSSKPTLIVSYNWGAIEWPTFYPLHRVPVVHVEDGFGPDEAAKRHPRRNLMRRAVFKYGVRRLIVVSDNLRNIALNEWKIPEQKLQLIHNGVDTNRFASRFDSTFARNQEDESSPIIIGTVAALRREKRIDRLIEATAILAKNQPRKIELWIIGEGEERENLVNISSRFSSLFTTVFHGQRADTEALLAKMTVYALSSDTEQAPISILEAMSIGLPIAAVDVGDVRKMVGSSNTTFVHGNTEQSLALSLRSLVINPDLRTQLGKENQIKCENEFSLQKSALFWRKSLLNAL
jgi:glycosyltransferase involved in cell wall biosynthesis